MSRQDRFFKEDHYPEACGRLRELLGQERTASLLRRVWPTLSDDPTVEEFCRAAERVIHPEMRDQVRGVLADLGA